MKKLSRLFTLALSAFMLFSCNDDDTKVVPNTVNDYMTPKYVFLFIGDGMATPQINITESTNNGMNLNMSKFPVAGMCTTHAEDRYITGSAASATALATGQKTTIGTISKTGDHSQNIKTMAEMAKEKGMRVGIVSSVSIDHATPACFYAHDDSRGNYYNIAAQMATSNFDYFGGGYAKGNFASKGPADIIPKMENAGYSIATTRKDLEKVKPGTKCWAYNHTTDGAGALVYEIDRPSSHLSLAEFTKKGIELLDNEDGFFMMVEAGKVDWACHANDAVSAAKDMEAFDKAIGEAIDFYNEHPKETIIIVTGDHECGGLTLGYAATGYETAFNLLKNQKLSYDEFSAKVRNWKESESVNFTMALDSISRYFGLGNASLNAQLAISDYERERLEDAFNKSINSIAAGSTEEEKVIYGGYDALTVTVTHILNNKAGLDWTSYKHTGIPVPVFALGQGQYEFNGYYDNTDVAKKIMKIANLNK